ncbi:MAG: DUF4129 domain-containing protein [Fimbriimonadales bacterium]|nr:DUF4129 domain-containing protein [Fimbriimonadales bacterium]
MSLAGRVRLARMVALQAGLLLWLTGWTHEATVDALAKAERLLRRAQAAEGVERQRLVEQARHAIASLPAEARGPLEQKLLNARLESSPNTLRSALREIETYQATMEGNSPASNPDKVRAQLKAIFAEPDMQPPPKPLIERIGEAIGRAFEALIRWLTRLLGGLGGAGAGGWGAVVQWIIIAILVLLIAFGASYLVGRLEWRRGQRAPTLLPPDQLVDARLLSAADWRALAHQLLARGDRRAAVRALYLGLLRLLHEARWLDYDPARTNWEHLMHLRSPALPAPAPREHAYHLLQPLTLRFDYLWYGNEPATAEDVQQFEQAFETLSRMVRADAQRVA